MCVLCALFTRYCTTLYYIMMSSSSTNSLYMLWFNGRGMRAHGVMKLQLKPMLLLVDEYVMAVQSSVAHVDTLLLPLRKIAYMYLTCELFGYINM